MVKTLEVKTSNPLNLKKIGSKRNYLPLGSDYQESHYPCDCDTFGGGDAPCDCNR